MRKKSISGVNESQKTRQIVYQRGNQKEGSPHYIFLYSEDDQSEDEDHFPLKQRSRKLALPRKIQVINVQIQSEDTLQALALRYQCTISDIKRINSIYKDNEIHAYQSIKVPVQPYSLLTESIDRTSEINQIVDLTPPVIVKADHTISRENQMISLLTIPVLPSSSVEINSIILNSTIEPLLQYNNESSQFTQDTEAVKLINSIESHEVNSSNNFVNIFKCSGADWALSWCQLLCFSLFLGFAGPIIYVLYITEFKDHSS
ncbi:PREDICTED: lysM and putative peptidoglycan-binding domain-containing protein 4 [Ceratosolen solmsi marchali]|uniref:LysM and putative peptidoglycan-binding domain-containing protein 4 n=1 Tax=Ceratosolen solmsi marchali TaxID=326594 RepID=A0AAJ6YIC5_9HYME|nr:PREDICTED: lysM and putative peptidoglycan-binding domain-containing protein 4 [Ceratosolen solmsi marchali]